MTEGTVEACRSAADLRRRIEIREATVVVVGLGYVGLPLAAAFHDAGIPVIGFDLDPLKIERLDRGENYLAHLGDEMTRRLADSDRFRGTSSPPITGIPTSGSHAGWGEFVAALPRRRGGFPKAPWL